MSPPRVNRLAPPDIPYRIDQSAVENEQINLGTVTIARMVNWGVNIKITAEIVASYLPLQGIQKTLPNHHVELAGNLGIAWST